MSWTVETPSGLPGCRQVNTWSPVAVRDTSQPYTRLGVVPAPTQWVAAIVSITTARPLSTLSAHTPCHMGLQPGGGFSLPQRGGLSRLTLGVGVQDIAENSQCYIAVFPVASVPRRPHCRNPPGGLANETPLTPRSRSHQMPCRSRRGSGRSAPRKRGPTSRPGPRRRRHRPCPSTGPKRHPEHRRTGPPAESRHSKGPE